MMNGFSASTSRALLILSLGGLVAGAAFAQTPAYPSKPIRMVIALAPGGGVDTTGRFIALKLGEAWGQSVVADNRPGAGGSIAAEPCPVGGSCFSFSRRACSSGLVMTASP